MDGGGVNWKLQKGGWGCLEEGGAIYTILNTLVYGHDMEEKKMFSHFFHAPWAEELVFQDSDL